MSLGCSERVCSMDAKVYRVISVMFEARTLSMRCGEGVPFLDIELSEAGVLLKEPCSAVQWFLHELI